MHEYVFFHFLSRIPYTTRLQNTQLSPIKFLLLQIFIFLLFSLIIVSRTSFKISFIIPLSHTEKKNLHKQ